MRDFTGWGDTQLKVHLSRLVELEYVLTHRAEHGQGLVYELVYDGQGKDGRRFLSGLIDVEKLKTAQQYDGQRSGVNGERSGSGRPLVGGWSGPGRAEKHHDSSCENAEVPPVLVENAHLDGKILKAAS